jgi:hypothetical protein
MTEELKRLNRRITDECGDDEFVTALQMHSFKKLAKKYGTTFNRVLSIALMNKKSRRSLTGTTEARQPH